MSSLPTKLYQTKGMNLDEKLSALEYNVNVARIDRLFMGGDIFLEEKYFMGLIIDTRIKMIKKKYCE